MKNKFIIFLSLFTFAFSQASLNDLRALKNADLDIIKDQMKGSKVDNTDSQISLPIEPVILNPSNATETDLIDDADLTKDPDISEYFGYDYFKKEINFYDNIPTPSDFKLGPGDEVVLSLWGETNSRENFIINKEGLIYYENIGFINISNKSLNVAELILTDELSRIFSTLKDKNSTTKLMLELGKLKSINVYFSGQIKNPGIHLVHPFSDIFTAISQAGGIDKTGSLRKIKLIRNEEVIDTIDFYSFFNSGIGNFQKNRIIDGDVIHIPFVDNRVKILGEIEKPQYYELLKNDSLFDLIDFAGGVTALSSKKAVIRDIVPPSQRLSDDNTKSGRLINLDSSKNIFLNNGSEVRIVKVADNDTDVFVFGRVSEPGAYPINSSTLKDVLDTAGGFKDPIFRKTIRDDIQILRLDENQFYSQEYVVNYKDSDTFILEVGDRIFVYENPNYDNPFIFTINGEVNKPGTFPLDSDTTVSDAIKLAEGLTAFGSMESVIVTQLFQRLDLNGDIIDEREIVKDVNEDFKITNESIITVLRKSNVVKVDGNVYSPGLVAYSKGMTLANAVELAGGFKPNSLKKQVYVIRSNGEIEKVNLFNGRLKRIFPGDSVFIPVDPDPSEFDITQFVADFSSTLANIAAILILVDNNN